MKSLWIVPETAGGIRNYADVLAPEMGEECRVVFNLPEWREIENAAEKLVHIQHEFGLFGSKLPGFYIFPKWMKRMKKANPSKKWIVTSHTVLGKDWKYSTSGRGIRALIYRFLNGVVLPFSRRSWIQGTWGQFDGVIVHSKHQLETVLSSGCRMVEVIPHFVPKVSIGVSSVSRDSSVLLFGYFSPEKGQDIAIRAWAILGQDAPKLVLAGGVRREEDQWYYDSCIHEISRLGLKDKIEITGYVKSEEVGGFFSRAGIVLAPFRETSGSGSLATALGFGSAVLASDLPLNCEIDERVPGSITFFKSNSTESLAAEIKKLMNDASRIEKLRECAKIYADSVTPEKIARLHHAFYQKVVRS